MRLILFRHGPSGHGDSGTWITPVSRSLSERGVQRTHAAARGLAKFEPGIRLILTSPALPASQTARLLSELVPMSRLQICAALGPEAPLHDAWDAVRGCGVGDVVLVGHDPHLGTVASTLLSGAPAPFKIKKAGACAIDFAGDPEPGRGRLAWFLPPRALRRLGGKKRPVSTRSRPLHIASTPHEPAIS